MSPQSSLALPLFLVEILGLSILATWIFLHTEGSVLALALFHFMVNSSMDVFGTPLPAATVVVVVAAALVVALDRELGWVGHAHTQGVRGDMAAARGA